MHISLVKPLISPAAKKVPSHLPSLSSVSLKEPVSSPGRARILTNTSWAAGPILPL